jgi:hypothetical protein
MIDAEILLAKCRRASLELRLADASIEEVAVPLRRGWISVPGAIAMLRNNGAVAIVMPELDTEEIAA